MRLVGLNFSGHWSLFCVIIKLLTEGFFNDGNESPSPKRKENQRKRDLLIRFGAIPILKYHFLNMGT